MVQAAAFYFTQKQFHKIDESNILTTSSTLGDHFDYVLKLHQENVMEINQESVCCNI
jgi:hypothetical protein